MKTLIIYFALCVAALAEMPYLEMRGAATNINQEVANLRYDCKDIEDAKKIMEIEYTNKFAGQTITATYHQHRHGEKNQSCVETVLKVFTGAVKPDLSKFIKMESVETNRYALPIKIFMPVTDKVAADKIEASVKAEYPAKQFTVTEKTSAEVIK